jgi:hypothetical protein
VIVVLVNVLWGIMKDALIFEGREIDGFDDLFDGE